MLKRYLQLPPLVEKKSFFLFGPRATGKSSLIQQQFNSSVLIIDLLQSNLFLQLSAHPEELESIEKYRNKKTILVFNKIDLPQRMNINKILEKTPGMAHVKISALKKTNIDILRKKMQELFVPHPNEHNEIILCLRQKHILEDILATIKKCRNLLSEGYPEEFLAEEIRRSVSVVEQLTGEIRTEDILHDIFKRFCVGK